jgi:hypothetical protein
MLLRGDRAVTPGEKNRKEKRDSSLSVDHNSMPVRITGSNCEQLETGP